MCTCDNPEHINERIWPTDLYLKVSTLRVLLPKRNTFSAYFQYILMSALIPCHNIIYVYTLIQNEKSRNEKRHKICIHSFTQMLDIYHKRRATMLCCVPQSLYQRLKTCDKFCRWVLVGLALLLCSLKLGCLGWWNHAGNNLVKVHFGQGIRALL